jgi:GT2 family glycosyltransferase
MPRPYGLSDLTQPTQLAAGKELGSWVAGGDGPLFTLPCELPVGWIQIRLVMNSSEAAEAEMFLDSSAGSSENIKVGRVDLSLTAALFVHLKAPVSSIRLRPVNRPCEFRLLDLQIRPVHPAVVGAHRILGKVRRSLQGRHLARSLGKGLLLLLTGRWRAFSSKVATGLAQQIPPTADHDYGIWQGHHGTTDADREKMRRESARLANPPILSVLMAVGDAPERSLRLAIDSVRSQLYPHWELCPACEASASSPARAILEEYASVDRRIKAAAHPSRGGIAAAANAAMELASGSYVASLDGDGLLAEHALYKVAKAIGADAALDMLYTDEDRITPDGHRHEPFFKPDWSPEYLLSWPYVGRLAVYRTSLLRAVAGFRSGFDGSQDYDLALRVLSRTPRVHHIPDVLYHRRMPSTLAPAGAVATPAATLPAAHRAALQAYLEEIGCQGTVEPGPAPGYHRVRYRIEGNPKVSIVVPTACKRLSIGGRKEWLVLNCIRSIRDKSTYANTEIVVVENLGMPEALHEALRGLGARVIPFHNSPFNYSAVNNFAARQCDGDHLLFVNDDVAAINPDWIEAMLEFSQRPDIGAVGAKLYYPDGRLQHVGLTLLESREPAHLWSCWPGWHRGYFNSNATHRNVLAVTGACLMTRAKVFRSLGGLSEDFPLNYNDVDYCLKALSAGLRIVFTPYAELYHHETATRKAEVRSSERLAFLKKWSNQWPRDPYYNPNLSAATFDYRINLDHAR